MGYDVLGANGDLTAAEVELLQMTRREFRLKMALDAVADQYDFILIDNPPSLSLLTVNALASSDGVIIPMQCEYYALEGISALVGTIDKIHERLNPRLKIEGILRTMFDPRMSLTKDVSDHLLEYFGDQVYRTVIPRNVRLAEAPSHGLPAIMWSSAQFSRQSNLRRFLRALLPDPMWTQAPLLVPRRPRQSQPQCDARQRRPRPRREF